MEEYFLCWEGKKSVKAPKNGTQDRRCICSSIMWVGSRTITKTGNAVFTVVTLKGRTPTNTLTSAGNFVFAVQPPNARKMRKVLTKTHWRLARKSAELLWTTVSLKKKKKKSLGGRERRRAAMGKESEHGEGLEKTGQWKAKLFKT